MRYTLKEASEYLLSQAVTDLSIFDEVPMDLLTEPFRSWALALEAVVQRSGRFDRPQFLSECSARHIPATTNWLVPGVDRQMVVTTFIEMYGVSKIWEHTGRARQRLEQENSVADVLAELEAGLADVPRMSMESEVLLHGYPEVRVMEGAFADWVVPGMLRHGHRLVLTGGEGWGKSTLLYQIALCAGFGVDPLGVGGPNYEPQKVYILDVENWHETQVKEHYNRLDPLLRRLNPDVDQPSVWLDAARMIDLSQPFQRRAFIDRVDRIQPDLVVMGAGYKMVSPQTDWRLEAQYLQSTADEIRAKTGAAICIETHAGHGEGGNRAGWRPEGSSYWLRWPEFGLGLVPRRPAVERKIGEPKKRLLQVRKWRGNRDSDIDTPYGWLSAQALPFVAEADKEAFERLALPEKAGAA